MLPLFNLSPLFMFCLSMSLFPAYSYSENKNGKSEEESSTSQKPEVTSGWLENTSFPARVIQLTQKLEDLSSDDESSSENSVKSTDDEILDSAGYIPKVSKKADKARVEVTLPPPKPNLDFTGDEEFYVDKNRAKQYLAVETLHKPACPRYRIMRHTLGRPYSFSGKLKTKRRYYRYSKNLDTTESSKLYPLTEEEYTTQMGEFNRKTMESCRDIKNWLDLIALQDRNPYKWSRLRVAEKKIDYIEKALNFLPYHTDLYAVYIAIITQCYTSHDVSKMLDAMLTKDPYSLPLWQAQIMCTQGTMARCNVPDVLRIYERCMKKMFHNQKASASPPVTDSVMMRLFYTCALFLRQSGLYEQFFALIKLGIELNVPDNAMILEDLQPRAEDENTLVEYEELILQSGLPMNEIWLRIEKLRQGFFFLPFPGDSAKCSDPQRIVFNEDDCHYVYPLKNRENSFKLLLIVIKLLKVPFIQSHCLANELEGDTDAIEDLLAIYTHPQCNWTLDHTEFFESLYDLSKEMSCSPTYLNHCIGYEIYSECVQKFLLNCSKAYDHIDNKRRLAFLMLWCHFQRLLLILEKQSKKLTPDYVKQGRKLFKSLLKQPINRKCLLLYVEFARYEYEADSSLETVENVFKNLIEGYNQEENLSSELDYVYLTYAEILLKNKAYERVSHLLSLYALNCSMDSQITNASKLVALNSLKEKVESVIKIEENVNIMLLDQYIMPDHTLTLLKIYILLLFTLQQKQQALAYMQKLLIIFSSEENPRHRYLRENFYEIYISLLQLPGGNSYVSHALIHQTILKALREFPNNLFLLQKWGCQSSLPWYKLRTGFTAHDPTIKSIIYLIVLARCRFINNLSDSKDIESSKHLAVTDLHYHEMIVRQRILNLFKMLVHDKASSSSTSIQPLLTSLLRNSLFWRCYLRCLSDQSCSFELGKQCLLTSLDECPWSKALYLDGATYVPQELSHLQDLIIEKQLRIYALPEELEILRQR